MILAAVVLVLRNDTQIRLEQLCSAKKKCGCEDFTTPINVTYCKYYCLIAVYSAVLFGFLYLLI